MRAPKNIRVPVSVRIGRFRIGFRMPPLYLNVSNVDIATANATVEVRPGLLNRIAMWALPLAAVPLAALAYVLRTDAEVSIGPEEAP